MTQVQYRRFKEKIEGILWRLDCRDEVQPEFYLTPEQATDELMNVVQEAMDEKV